MPYVLPRILLWRKLLPIDWWRPAWLASCLSPACVDLVRARLLLVKQPLEEFHRLRRLGLPAAESPTRIVIPMALAPETGEISWVSMGLRWVLFLAEVYSRPSKSQDPLSGSEVVALMAKSRGVSPAILGRAGSRTGLALGCSAAASRCPAPRNLNRFGV
jgi:hypothetical protein